MATLKLPGDDSGEFEHGDVYFIGNATTLVKWGGITILTDPAFLHKGQHIPLGGGLYARREAEPACQVADLPPLDLMVLSHFHPDHFDDVAASELPKHLPIITTADAVGKLRGIGFDQGQALSTWDSHTVEKGGAKLRVTAMPARHAVDDAAEAFMVPVNGHMLEFIKGDREVYRLYISGDTMPIDRLLDIAWHFPDIDLGMYHTGGAALFLTTITMTGEQAVRVIENTKPKVAIPLHYDDYSICLSGLDDFKKAAAKSSGRTKFNYLAHGESYKFSVNN